MNSEIKTKWIETLLSGKYKQGTGALRKADEGRGDTFCCLGVLCDIMDPENWEARYEGYAMYHKGRSAAPHTDFLVLADLEENDVDSLMDMNDVGNSFAIIAEVIKDTL